MAGSSLCMGFSLQWLLSFQSTGSRCAGSVIVTHGFVEASLVSQLVKNPSAMWKTGVQSLGWEDVLEKGMATHSSILAWRIPWTEEPGRLQSWSHKEWDMTEQLLLHFTWLSCPAACRIFPHQGSNPCPLHQQVDS